MAMFSDFPSRTLERGQFREKEYGKYFEFKETKDDWAIKNELKFEIAVGPLGEIRFANILKTVAYVAVDEDCYGNPVLEKWSIKEIFRHKRQK